MDALSPAEIEAFERDGFLVLRSCFSREAAEAMVRATFVERSLMPEVTVRDGTEVRPVAADDVDLATPSSWRGATRLDVATGRSEVIATFAPRLWAAIEALCGEGRTITRTSMGEMWILNGDR